MVLRFREFYGTQGSEVLIGATGTIMFGRGGDDSLTSYSGSAFSVLVGGRGNDVYGSLPDTTITIADLGSSPNDVLVTSTLSLASNGVTALIDGRHFAAFDFDTGEAVYLLDFLSEQNYIEEIQTPDGTFSSIEVFQIARTLPSYLGNLAWEDLPSYGIYHPYSTAETNEAISFYGNRAIALEASGAVRDPSLQEIADLQPVSIDVVASTYQFFTGRVPTGEGFEYLIASSANPADLNDTYYLQFNNENRFINFANNLASFGEGREEFAAEFGSLSFEQTVRVAFEDVIGSGAVIENGGNPEASINFFLNARGYFEAVALERVVPAGVSLEEATKVVAIGSILNEATKAGVGDYAEAIDDLIIDLRTVGTSDTLGGDLFAVG